MADTFTEVSSQSWFGRIGGAIKGVLFGLVLVVGSFVLLFWNEGRTVERYNSLKEGEGAVQNVSPDQVNPVNEAKLVYAAGPAATAETVADPEFGVSVPAIKLIRRVTMYQWEESSKSDTHKNLGGGSTTETTYSYQRNWADGVIDSSRFKQPQGHANPAAMQFTSQTFAAHKVTLGAFTLSDSLVAKINNGGKFTADAATLPPALAAKARPFDGGYYLGADPAQPAVGDLKVAFQTVLPGNVSLISQQARDTFCPYLTKSGGSIELLETGMIPQEQMFKHAEASNSTLAWILRGVGFVAMAIGFILILNPLSVFADVVPFFGTIVQTGAAFIGFVAAAACSAVTIAVAWFAYRPLLSCGLIVAAAACLFLFKFRAKSAAQAPTA